LTKKIKKKLNLNFGLLRFLFFKPKKPFFEAIFQPCMHSTGAAALQQVWRRTDHASDLAFPNGWMA